MAVKCPACQFINTSDSKFCKECGTKFGVTDQVSLTKTIETSSDEFGRGTTFAGRYEIIEELGAGGMGRVFRVYDTKIKEEVALKLLKPEIASERRTIERFSNEIKYARKIIHKNVCRMFDLGEDRGTHFITMEYVSGEDLKSFLRRAAPLNTGRAVSLACEIAEGMAEAHKVPLVHRDLKPGNIMIDKEGHARIMDFGIAKSLSGKAVTGEGTMIGTPEYMSPEQVEGKEVDRRADIYAFGVILFEMVTGRTPFEGDTPLAIAVKHKSEPAPAPRTINPQIPQDLNKLILRCLEKDKGKRYQTAEELLADLALVERSLPVTDRILPRAKTETRTGHEITVNIAPKKLLIPAAAIVALAIALIKFWPPPNPPKPEKTVPIGSPKPSLAIPYFENIFQDPSLEMWRVGLPELLIRGLSQSRLMRVLLRAEIDDILNKLELVDAKKYSMSQIKTIAEKGRVNTVLNGSLMRAGDAIEITAYLITPGMGETLQPILIKAKDEADIFAKADDLIREIKRGLGISAEKIVEDAGRPVGQITTRYPEAFRLLMEWGKHFYRYEFEKSLSFAKKAIEIDPEYAEAFLCLGENYSRLGRRRERQEAIEKALALSGRLPEKERLWTEGLYYLQWERTYNKTLTVYEKLLQLYADELGPYVNIQAVYLYVEEWEKVISVSQDYLKNGGMFAFGHGNLAWAFCAVGNYNEARRIYKDYLQHEPGQMAILLSYADSYLWEGRYDMALAEWKKLPADFLVNLDPLMTRVQIHALTGDLESAQKELFKWPNKDAPVMRPEYLSSLANLALARGQFAESTGYLKEAIGLAEKAGEARTVLDMRLNLAALYLRLSNYGDALIESRKARNISMALNRIQGERQALAYQGAAHIGLGQMNEARSTAEMLDKVITEGLNKKSRRLHFRLLGLISLKEGKYARAVDSFKKAIALLPYQSLNPNPHAEFYEPLALAYYASGDLERAREEYERITLLGVGRFAYGDIYAKVFYMLGKIAEQQGKKAEARAHYQKFLSLWKNADPSIREVADAKKRLASL